MKTFFCKLNPPRPTFSLDMTPDEMRLMQEHVLYWTEWMHKGRVVTFGLVGDPNGPYGIGIMEVEDDSEIERLTASDPVIRADSGFSYEVHPMPRGAIHPRHE